MMLHMTGVERVRKLRMDPTLSSLCIQSITTGMAHVALQAGDNTQPASSSGLVMAIAMTCKHIENFYTNATPQNWSALAPHATTTMTLIERRLARAGALPSDDAPAEGVVIRKAED